MHHKYNSAGAKVAPHQTEFMKTILISQILRQNNYMYNVRTFRI